MYHEREESQRHRQREEYISSISGIRGGITTDPTEIEKVN